MVAARARSHTSIRCQTHFALNHNRPRLCLWFHFLPSASPGWRTQEHLITNRLPPPTTIPTENRSHLRFRPKIGATCGRSFRGRNGSFLEVPCRPIAIPRRPITIARHRITIPQRRITIPRRPITIPRQGIKIPRSRITIARHRITIPRCRIKIPRCPITIPRRPITIPCHPIPIP